MSEFDALGRDVAAAADSLLDSGPAQAVKQLWVWAGFDQGTNPNHLWTVEYWKNENGFAVAATVKDKNVYVPEVAPSPPATAEELAVTAGSETTDPEVVADAPADVPSVDEPVAYPSPEATPVDPPVAASSSQSSDISSGSATDAAAS